MHEYTQEKESKWGPLTAQRIVDRCPMAYAGTFCQSLEGTGASHGQTDRLYENPDSLQMTLLFLLSRSSEQLASFSKLSVLYLRHSASLK